MSDSVKLFEELTTLDATSGFESEVSDYLIEKLSPYADEIKRDNLGGVYAVKKSKNKNAKTIMISSHMDEVGFIITKVLKNGFLKFETLGGFREDVLLAQKFTITNYVGKKFTGVIATVPKHFLGNTSQNVPISAMALDVGATSKEEVYKMGIKEGDFVTPKTNFEVLNENKIMAKAVDNRYGCAIILEIFKELKDQELNCNLVVCATTQEEVGLRGATAAANLVQPDICFVVDCSPANDLDSSDKYLGKLGNGFLVRLVDRTMILRPKLREKIISVAEENNIKYQYYTSPGGTDGGVIHQANYGIPTAVIGICARYIHTHNALFDIRDYYEAKKILKKLIPLVDDKFLEELI